MLDTAEMEIWCQRLHLNNEARSLIYRIRTSQPVRAVRSSKGNVRGRYPSRKMGVTIQFESHKNELAFIHEYEHDDDVLEYYDQPSTIKLDYEAANGRRLGVLHTPDFFVIRTAAAGWEECKVEEQLVSLSSRNSNRYAKDAADAWRCPPGEAFAENLGLYYRVRSSREINWYYQRSIEFLDDYLRTDSLRIETNIRNSVLALVTENPGISLTELLNKLEGVCNQDHIFTLLVNGALFINLRDAPLAEPDKVRVFSDRGAADAITQLTQTSFPHGFNIHSVVNLTVGNTLRWGSNLWVIANIDNSVISLVNEDKDTTEISTNAFEKLVRDGRITGVNSSLTSNIHPEVERRIAEADKSTYDQANRRYAIIRAYQSGEPLPVKANVSERTIRRWISQFRAAHEAYGNGYVGLLQKKRIGNTNSRLPEASRSLIDEFIENEYETYKQKGKRAAYAAYRLKCERHAILAASYKTFCKSVKRRLRYEQLLRRQGAKSAYREKEFCWRLTQTTPRHGERPLHIAHIDHTELDEELVCSLTGNKLGRAWATFLTDAYSRRLAVHVTYDPPSYRSCMMIMRECVRRFGRFPQIVVVDGGKEFSGTYFETLLARYECTKKTRPPAESRFGSICERLFNTSNTQFIHNLQGNTQIMRNVRQVTKAINPKQHAVWTLEKLSLYLREWAYEVYDTIEHSSLGHTPRDAFNTGLINTGERTHRLIPYNDEFRIFTLPTTAKGTAKVYPGRGVKINRIYYWSDAFRHPDAEGKQVSVRYDPFDVGSSFAYVRGQWTKCLSEYPSIFNGRSEREIMIATDELRRRQRLHSSKFNFSATKLAHFLESVEAEEILLRQRLADRAADNAMALAHGGLQREVDLATTYEPRHVKDSGNCELTSSTPSLTLPTDLKVYEEF